MGDFDKKYIIREAESIIQDFNKKDKEEKKNFIKLKNEFSKIKKINIALKIIIAVMAVCIVMLIIH